LKLCARADSEVPVFLCPVRNVTTLSYIKRLQFLSREE